ncbi:hypothetical protein TNCV_2650811 [Trichonephila clavipes]|nr:hypothetical protein TNCV_2650811 [Trichonephila clavipes]
MCLMLLLELRVYSKFTRGNSSAPSYKKVVPRRLFKSALVLRAASGRTYLCLEAPRRKHVAISSCELCPFCDGIASHWTLIRVVGDYNKQPYISQILRPIGVPYLRGFGDVIFEEYNARTRVSHWPDLPRYKGF